MKHIYLKFIFINWYLYVLFHGTTYKILNEFESGVSGWVVFDDAVLGSTTINTKNYIYIMTALKLFNCFPKT